MVLCEALEYGGNFAALWGIMSIAAYSATMGMSGTVFYKYYAKPTFETWCASINAAMLLE